MPSRATRLGGTTLTQFVPTVVRKQFVLKFAVAVFAAVLVAGGIGGFLYVDATQTLDQRVESRVVSTAQLQASGLDSWASGFRRQTRTLSSVREFQNGQPNVIKDYLLLEASDLTSAFVAVHYVQASDGTIEASTSSGVTGKQLSELGVPWGSNMSAIDNQTDTSSTVLVPDQPYRSPVTNDTVLAFISSSPQNTEHVLVVEANLSARAEKFHQAMADGETTVLGPDGSAILGSSVTFSSSAVNTTGFTQTGNTVYGHARAETLGWTVVTHVPASSAYGLRNRIGSSLLLTLLSALLVLGGATLVVGHRSATALGRLSEKASAMKRGELDVSLDSNRVDEIGQLFDAFDEMRESLQQQISTAEAAKERAETAKEQAESARAEADEARNEAMALTEQLETRAEEYGDVMAACADGDLRQRMDTDAENEAMVQIATAYNDVMDEWETTLREVRAFSEAVQSASDDVSENVSAVRTRSDEVRNAAIEMADGADRQSDELQTVWEKLEAVSATVEEMSATADSVRARADDALDQSRAGRDAATSAASALADIESSTDQAVQEVEQLETLMEDIESVTDLISDIADQTNMLALNANIEAARADAAGDGFAVVADEVKTLADQTVDATGEIESSIQRMRTQIERTVEEMHATQNRVDTGTETVEDAFDAFDGIVEEIEAATSGMREIDRTTAEQAESTQKVVAMVETVGDISDRTATEAASVVTATSDQVRTVSDVETDVTELSEQATELRSVLETFDIDSESVESSETAPGGNGDGTEESDRTVSDLETTVTEVLAEETEVKSVIQRVERDDDVGPTESDDGSGTDVFEPPEVEPSGTDSVDIEDRSERIVAEGDETEETEDDDARSVQTMIGDGGRGDNHRR